MSKLRTLVQRAPKRLSAAVAMIAAAVVVPAALLAWGPVNRPLFTVDKPADHIAFNSIVDEKHGIDERNFVVIKDAANTAEGGWQDEINVQPGKEYLVRMEVHNNAADNLNLVATNTRVKANVPTTTGKSVQIDGFVTTDNWGAKKNVAGKYGEVWDQVILKSGNGQDFNLAYVANSAIMYNNHFGQTGKKLANSIVEKAGAPVGYKDTDGKLPGCFQYKAYVTFKVKPQFTAENDFTVKKEVRKSGDTDKTWKKTVAVNPGDTVEYRINYDNTGDTRQNNVHVRDYLPAGMSYVAGSTKIANPTHPQYVPTDDGITVGNGLNIGDYAAGTNAYLIFSAKVAAKKDLVCGPNTLKNVARITADGGYKEDSAVVTVNGDECQPEKVKACNTKTGVIEDVDKGKENTPPHTTDMSKCKKIEACNTQTGEIEMVLPGQANTPPYTTDLEECDEPEPEMVEACNTETGEIEEVEKGKENTPPYTTDLTKCEDEPEPEMVEACNTKTGEIEEVEKGKENTPPHTTDLTKCEDQPTPEKVEACNTETGVVEKVEKGQENTPPHTTDLKKCEKPIKEVPVCDESTGKIITVPETEKDKYGPVDSDKCKPTTPEVPETPETPETPSELPPTGAADVLQAILGVGSLTAAGYYYVASRRG